MNANAAFAAGVLRVMFLRASPERLVYARRRLVVGLLAALVVSGFAQWAYHGDGPVFVMLRVFAETTVFALWMTLLTARVARLRLSGAMLSLVWISFVGDVLLVAASALPLGAAQVPFALLWGAVVAYGAGSVVAWALRRSLVRGLVHVGLYLAAVTLLDQAFRALFAMAAA